MEQTGPQTAHQHKVVGVALQQAGEAVEEPARGEEQPCLANPLAPGSVQMFPVFQILIWVAIAGHLGLEQ